MSETTLYRKLAEVVAELGYVAKDGKNEFQGYKYTSAEALLAAVRDPLSTHKIALVPSLTAISEREYTTSKGKASVITTAHVRFTLVDGETGEKHECDWAGQGDDPADKGLGKAYTNAVKTFLRQQFLIPQGDDPEADKGADERGADRQPAKAKSADAKAAWKADTNVLPPERLVELRRMYKETGWTAETLRLNLAAIGVGDVTDVGKAINGLTPAQAGELTTAMNGAIDAWAG